MRARLLAIAALFLMAPQCGEVCVLVYLDPPTLSVAQGQPFSVDVVIAASGLTTVQAWELGISGDPQIASPVGADVHAEFDDDGQLFVIPELDVPAAKLRRIVDLRHGTPASGTFRAVTINAVAGAPGEATLSIIGGGVATPNGGELATIRFGTVVTVTP